MLNNVRAASRVVYYTDLVEIRTNFRAFKLFYPAARKGLCFIARTLYVCMYVIFFITSYLSNYFGGFL